MHIIGIWGYRAAERTSLIWTRHQMLQPVHHPRFPDPVMAIMAQRLLEYAARNRRLSDRTSLGRGGDSRSQLIDLSITAAGRIHAVSHSALSNFRNTIYNNRRSHSRVGRIPSARRSNGQHTNRRYREADNGAPASTGCRWQTSELQRTH